MYSCFNQQLDLKIVMMYFSMLLLLCWMSSVISQTSPCPRFAPGSLVTSGPTKTSLLGALYTQVYYRGGFDSNNMPSNCFMLNDFDQSPTLRVNPGDTIYFTVTNQFAGFDNAPAQLADTTYYATCGSQLRTPTSVNVHFHGLHSPPQCHGDEVVRTIINKGETFKYVIQVPSNQPPGLYWYHPHIHGLSEIAVKGGATGAIIVNGIVNYKPYLTGLREQVFILRDNDVGVSPSDDSSIPSFDMSINYVPITHPDNTPAVIEMRSGETQFWRVVNTASTTIVNLTFTYDGIFQPYTIMSIDTSPLSVDRTVTSYIVGPGNRIEFTLKGPTNKVKSAVMSTQTYITGPVGDKDYFKTLAIIRPNLLAVASGLVLLPSIASKISTPSEVLKLNPSIVRKLYFSQIDDPVTGGTIFYITEMGKTPIAFSRSNPPAITVTQGTVEDWVIENRAGEAHVFHIHQIRFLHTSTNDITLPTKDMTFLDVITVPYWSMNDADPYPSVTLRLDFTANWIVGDFMYHCHILEHEDKGMMQVVHVNPAPTY